ncbi:MAG: hypothetical protein IPM34_13105 [Saprospiraceae bacterium]|nr:hypothetical protein [Saprospiraceae bacterium]
MKQYYLTFILFAFAKLLFSQSPITVEGKNQYLKKTDNIIKEFSIFTFCQDKKLIKNCANYYLGSNNNYQFLPISNSQINSCIANAHNFNKISGLKSEIHENIELNYLQSGQYRTYIAMSSESELSFFPVHSSNDVFILARITGPKPKPNPNPKKPDPCEKCAKLPFCRSGDLKSDDCLRKQEKWDRCWLQCRGIIKTTAKIPPMSGFTVSTILN